MPLQSTELRYNPAMTMLMLLVLTPIRAGDIYIRREPDGSVTFTDSPQARDGYTVFLREKPLPSPARVNVREFPGLDAYDSLILDAAARYALSEALIKAVALAESGMNRYAVSPAGAQGLMQLMPGTAAELAVSDPFDPAQAIDGGARYLAQQLRRFGSVPLALAAYNAGPGAVARHNGVPPIPETQVYVERVMALYDHFRYQRPLVQTPEVPSTEPAL